MHVKISDTLNVSGKLVQFSFPQIPWLLFDPQRYCQLSYMVLEKKHETMYHKSWYSIEMLLRSIFTKYISFKRGEFSKICIIKCVENMIDMLLFNVKCAIYQIYYASV